MSYWLLKTEPSTYSFEQLLKEKHANWNGVRNYQARNNLRLIRIDDLVIIYHSGDDKAAIGTAKVVKEAYPDEDMKKPGDWVQIDLVPGIRFSNPVTLSTIKSTESLRDLPLIRHTRLSVMPISKSHFKIISKLGKKGGIASD